MDWPWNLVHRVGVNGQLFAQDWNTLNLLTTPTWLSHTWQFQTKHGIWIETMTPDIPLSKGGQPTPDSCLPSCQHQGKELAYWTNAKCSYRFPLWQILQMEQVTILPITCLQVLQIPPSPQGTHGPIKANHQNKNGPSGIWDSNWPSPWTALGTSFNPLVSGYCHGINIHTHQYNQICLNKISIFCRNIIYYIKIFAFM